MLHPFRGQEPRISTKEESLSKAKEVAEDWYLQLRGKLRSGEIKSEKTFREASERFLREYDIINQGQRNQRYVEGQHWRSRLHLVPFFGNLGLSEVTVVKVQFTATRKPSPNAEAAGAQYPASGNGHAAPDSENGPAPPIAGGAVVRQN